MLLRTQLLYNLPLVSTVRVESIIPESFHVLNVSARWVYQNLSAHDRCQWVASPQELLSSYTSDEKLFCCRLVTGDRMWIYHWDPLSKLEFTQWKDVDRPTFTWICISAINWLDYGNSFSGIDRLLMTDYLHPGKTTTGQYYAEPTFKLLNVIKQKQWQKLSFRSWLFHDNAPAHKSLVAQQVLCNCEAVQLNHPAYSLDLATSNYFLIINLKYRLRRTWFIDDESLKIAVKA